MSENLIELKNVRKEFVTAKHYPGFKGAVKSLFSKEKIKIGRASGRERV